MPEATCLTITAALLQAGLDGELVKEVVAQTLSLSRVSASEIVAIKAHGTGTKDNDLSEGLGLHKLFGEKLPPVVSLKGAMGHASGRGGNDGDSGLAILPGRRSYSEKFRFQPAGSRNWLCSCPEKQRRAKRRLSVHVLRFWRNLHQLSDYQGVMILSLDKTNIFKASLPVIAASFVGPALVANGDALWEEAKLPLNPDELVQKIMGQPMRRAGRFIKLVCCGALDCLQSVPKEILHDKKVGIFLSTGLGNIDEILPFITQVFKHDGGFPSPNQFANSVSNAAAFFLAREAGVKGIILTISEEELSFESALWLAQTYLESGEIDLALVGGCDVFTPTVAESRERMNLTTDNSRLLPVGEGSSWLLVGRGEQPKIGDILAGALCASGKSCFARKQFTWYGNKRKTFSARLPREG